jgi:hypothetical protein
MVSRPQPSDKGQGANERVGVKRVMWPQTRRGKGGRTTAESKSSSAATGHPCGRADCLQPLFCSFGTSQAGDLIGWIDSELETVRGSSDADLDVARQEALIGPSDACSAYPTRS